MNQRFKVSESEHIKQKGTVIYTEQFWIHISYIMQNISLVITRAGPSVAEALGKLSFSE